MTGVQLKNWAMAKGIKVPGLAEKVGVSSATVYVWFRSAELDRTTVLALAHIGCEPARIAARVQPASKAS